MLNAGYSLFETLIAIALSALIMLSAMAFYPQLHLSTQQIYKKYRLAEAVEQSLSGLIKDIRRAGFIANDPASINKNAITLNSKEDCIILRYDAESTGDWRYNPKEAKASDVFAYRYYKNNLEFQIGVINCIGKGWDKLFDQKEVKVTHFQIINHQTYMEIQLTALLKATPAIEHRFVRYIKNENR